MGALHAWLSVAAGTVGAVNAERHRSDAARQFEGEFETHLTLAPQAGQDSDEPIRGWAESHGLKYTRILLDRGRTPDQPMLTRRGEGTLSGQLAAAHAWAERLRGAGFHVTRVKVEAAPWNAGVPRTDAEATALPGHCYRRRRTPRFVRLRRGASRGLCPAEPGGAHTGRFCCSMYCRITESGAPPTVPAKYDPDHSLLARQ